MLHRQDGRTINPTRLSLSAWRTAPNRVGGLLQARDFGGPEHVLKDLARYTHRVVISNGRLLSLENGQVRFRLRDSRHDNRSSVMPLDPTEFIRRFLLHVLPAGFVKIRHFGLLANRNRRQALALCRIHLHATTPDTSTLLTEPQRSALNRSCPQRKRVIVN